MDTTFITLDDINHSSPSAALQRLSGLYEHAPWVVAQALAHRPFQSLAHLKQVLTTVLAQAAPAAQLALLRAQPELALPMPQQLSATYQGKFGFPFVLAVQGPRGNGLGTAQIASTLARRLHNHPDFELQENLRNLHRAAELRLNDLFNQHPTQGHAVWDWQQALAQFSEPDAAAQGQLTVTYLTDAHRACAAFIQRSMQQGGFDDVCIDAVGNVVGVYRSNMPHAKTLLTGSHYDTVRNAGQFDGRLGIAVPMACVQALHQRGERLPFHIEVVAFAEEEGQRFKATFLGSGALTGDFNPQWLDQQDADGITMRAAMQHAGLSGTLDAIGALSRNPADYLGFVEVHIEQGPILNARQLPLGVVTSINGSVRYVGEVTGMASHAGTTPMDSRRDAACAVAELALYLEQRAAAVPDLVGTMGQLGVPSGSINVVPGRCQFSLDIRATTDPVRDACATDVLAALARITTRRGLQYTLQETLRVAAAPSAPDWQARWAKAVHALGLPAFLLPSGAGHDAMKLHDILPQAMLFVRGENAGISHNPLESTTSCDMQLAVDAFNHVLVQLSTELTPAP